MSERKKRGSSRGTVTWKTDSITSPPTRRSGKNSPLLSKSTDSPTALASAESHPKTTSTIQQTTTTVATPQPTPKVSSGTPALRRSSRISPSSEKENVVLDKSRDVSIRPKDQSVYEIDVLSPIPLNIPQSPSYEDKAKVMFQKVRRSYSRLEMSLNGGSFLYSPTRDTDSSDTSTPNPPPKAGRRSLFGFDKLLSSESAEEESKKKGDEEEIKRANNESASGMSIGLSVEKPDPNIPGVALVKQKKRKRKIPQIEKSDLDEWAAAMNAQFEEAEKFDLVVE
ncbi:sororin isoform X2 [Pyxicephalus adspersus]|uniref:sororin isoform X2 n=1 Tax=Pyxicephalus adspersus TaxID=30357 RepID=UPI003B5AAB64